MWKRLAAVLFMAICVIALADDGWIGFSGTPKLMGSHPTVRMVSEIVRVTIHRGSAEVTCDFVFRNEGPATTVRMGFPDYDDNKDTVSRLRSTYDYFQSYVDGKRVQNRLEPVVEHPPEFEVPMYQEAYQVKAVRFGKGQTRRVREVYRQPLGSLALWGDVKGKGTPAHDVFSYIFATGATWKDKIGRAEMRITFARDATVSRGKLILKNPPEYDDTTEAGERIGWKFWAEHRNALAGSGDLKLKGRTLTLTKTNWKPSPADDISLAFGYYFRKH